MAATDLFTVDVLTLAGLRRFCVSFIIELKTRRAHIAGIPQQPYGEWMEQVAHHFTDAFNGFLRDATHLIPDRDPLFPRVFGQILNSGGVTPRGGRAIPLPINCTLRGDHAQCSLPEGNLELGSEMRYFRRLLCAIIVVFTLAGCSKSPEDKAASQMVEILDELGDVISSVNDETSASKAATKISEIGKRFTELVEQTNGFEGDPSEKMQKEVAEAQARLRDQLSNAGAKFAGNPQLMAKIMPAIIKLGSSVWKTSPRAPVQIEAELK